MTHSSNSDKEPNTRSNRRLWLLLLSRTGIVGLILLVGVVGGAWWE